MGHLKEEYKQAMAELDKFIFKGLDKRYTLSLEQNLRKIFDKGYSQIPEELMLIGAGNSSLIYISDSHYHKDDKDLVSRVISSIKNNSRNHNNGVFIEALPLEEKKAIDEFMREKKEKVEEFTKRLFLRNEDARSFKIGSYNKMIKDARQYEFHLFGVYKDYGKNGIRRRDKHMAEIISEAVLEFELANSIVFTGECHLSPVHLPALVSKYLRKKGLSKRSIIILQNNRYLYDRLGRGVFLSKSLVNDAVRCIYSYNFANPKEAYLSLMREFGMEKDKRFSKIFDVLSDKK